ncbi:hypothetical protein [Mesobacillus harenae]|uniref:hypothetical protein n=1 Tax=Mesobacillus harenae TaxID=2213203 RepID=UPI00157FD5D0|nr:hypothetical protein [Mesobacillus harenae]
MKNILTYIIVIGIAAGLYYLYQRQLGAISFFILSVFFFALARHQLSKRTTPDDENGSEKADTPEKR